MTKKSYFLISSLSLLIFIIFSYLVQKNIFINFDFDTTVRLQDPLGVLPERRAIDTLFSSLSIFGSLEILTLVLGLMMVLTRKIKSLILPLTFSFMHIIELIGKIFITQIGPPFMFLKTELPFSFPSFYLEPGFSYPSGHSARTVFISVIAVFLILKSRRINRNQKTLLILLLLIFDLGMLISRVYLGEHWVTDVAGGAILGFSLATLSLIFF